MYFCSVACQAHEASKGYTVVQQQQQQQHRSLGSSSFSVGRNKKRSSSASYTFASGYCSPSPYELSYHRRRSFCYPKDHVEAQRTGLLFGSTSSSSLSSLASDSSSSLFTSYTSANDPATKAYMHFYPPNAADNASMLSTTSFESSDMDSVHTCFWRKNKKFLLHMKKKKTLSAKKIKKTDTLGGYNAAQINMNAFFLFLPPSYLTHLLLLLYMISSKFKINKKREPSWKLIALPIMYQTLFIAYLDWSRGQSKTIGFVVGSCLSLSWQWKHAKRSSLTSLLGGFTSWICRHFPAPILQMLRSSVPTTNGLQSVHEHYADPFDLRTMHRRPQTAAGMVGHIMGCM